MTDHWKGEHFIRGRRLTGTDRKAQDSTLAAMVGKLRGNRVPQTTKDAHGKFITSAMRGIRPGQRDPDLL